MQAESSVTGDCQMFIKCKKNTLDDSKKISQQNNARMKRLKRQNESAEQRAARLSKQRAYDAEKRKSESITEREIRLSKKRKHTPTVRANESLEAREKRLLHKHQSDKTNCSIATQTVSELINKFHNAITVGPL